MTGSRKESSRDWKQHFPTYSFDERDIAIQEYQSATRTYESEERVFLNASNIALLITAGLGSILVSTYDKWFDHFEQMLPFSVILIVLSIFILLFAIITIRYFADRQRSIVFSGRKVIVMRRMLGLTYGSLHLVLPNWRIEGADEPFALRLFPGWNTYVAYPFYIQALFSTSISFVLFVELFNSLRGVWLISTLPIWFLAFLGSSIWLLILSIVYRVSLLDTHERVSQKATYTLAKIFRVKMEQNIEHVLYRANLATHEIDRFKIDTTHLRKMLIFIEDKSFISHSGVSFRGIIRAALGLLGLKSKSGGSTITQQLVRTLLIQDLNKLYRRKIVEILLALWFNKLFNKQEQLDLYLASVRYERHKYGLIAAMNHFWSELKTTPTKAEAFFLIERVSNIRSRLLTKRVSQTINNALAIGELNEADVQEIKRLYLDAGENFTIHLDDTAKAWLFTL